MNLIDDTDQLRLFEAFAILQETGAMERARDQPVYASIGSWKNPIAERGPKVSAAIRQPLAMISQGNPGSLLETVAVLIPHSPLRPREFIRLRDQRQAGKCVRDNSVGGRLNATSSCVLARQATPDTGGAESK